MATNVIAATAGAGKKAANVFAILTFFLVFCFQAGAEESKYRIGVYYFPGWKGNSDDAASLSPWRKIQGFPEREPLLSWYDEGAASVIDQQLEWMYEYGISYVVFDWYFSSDREIRQEHVLKAYLRSPKRTKVQFAILWANHDRMPKSSEDWSAMVHYWIGNYFFRSEYLKMEGRPVVFVFSADLLKTQAEGMGSTSKALLDSAQNLARTAGLPGIYFVAGTGANTPMIDSYAKSAGYDAFSAYNYQKGPGNGSFSHSYTELDSDYRKHWNKFAARGNLPLIVPMTSGWDKRPWGGSTDPAHDNCLSTPEQFTNHLEAAKNFIKSHRLLTQGMGVICCWNEFGEGSFIEPTRKLGFLFLHAVREVFGRRLP